MIFSFLINKFTKSELLLGSFWTAIGSGISRILITLGVLMSSNILGVEKFGEFSITRSTINLILVIAGLNLGSVLTKTIAEYKEIDINKAARIVSLNYIIIISFAFILGILTVFFSGFLANEIVNYPELEEQFRLGGAILVFAILFSLNESIYRGLEEYKRLGLLQVTASLSFLVFVPIGSFYYGVNGAVTGYLIYTFVMALITFFDLHSILVKKRITLFTSKNLFIEFEEVKRLTIPIFFSSIIEAPVFWYSQVLLIKYAGMSANGIASALLQTRNMILILPGYVSLVVLPILSKNLNDKEKYNKGLQKALFFNFIIATICVIPMIIFPSFFLKIYGKDFLLEFNYWESFLAYISVPFLVVSNVYQQSFVAKSKGWNSLKISIIWNLVLLVTVLILCKYFRLGVLGYMSALNICVLVQLFLRKYYDK